jgi:hypothetical protein
MRKAMFWFGWTIFVLLPIAFVTEVLVNQDLPSLPPWKLVIPVVAFVLIMLGRNRDDVLKHHVI